MLSWNDFRSRLLNRFGSSPYDDSLADLIKLQQTGNVADYQKKFDLLSKTRGVSKSQLVSYFVSGFQEEIKANVQIAEPDTLHKAVSMAKKNERVLNTTRKSRFNWDRKRGWTNNSGGGFNKAIDSQNNNHELGGVKDSASSTATTLAVKKVNSQEMQERRCYNCDEKYEVRHRYQKLFLLEVCTDFELGLEEDEEPTESEVEIPLNALKG